MNTEPFKPSGMPGVWASLTRNWLTIAQLVLVIAVVQIYEIEGQAFSRVMILAAAGFLASILLPQSRRLAFFVLLSIVGILWVLGLADGAYLLASGLVLIGVANLPVPIAYRIILLLGIAAVLAAYRSGMGTTPWSAAFWPIFGSMFMFRMILYIRAIRLGKVENGVWGTLAYFFMLPNVAFPLFPVVDYQTFNRNYFDRDDEAQIYQQGMLWIARGLLHLVLYRFVYHFVLTDVRDVVELSDLLRFMLGTFLLYLRVSGQFHIIVGLLHLFGFRLPETHKLYYLAHGFTELWRRINIYWTEFMMNTVFYPTYFKVKKLGPATAVALATGTVFLATWILHSYQWFWLRGGFPLHIQDGLFWAILGGLVILGALKELKSKKSVSKEIVRWSWQGGLRAAITFSIFCFLWSLWNSESMGEWIWMIGAIANVDAKGVVVLAVTFLVILFLGGWNWERIQQSSETRVSPAAEQAVRTIMPLLALLLLSVPTIQNALSSRLDLDLHSLQTTRLNATDTATQHRGYYEQLDVRTQLTATDPSAFGDLRSNWQDPSAAGIINERADILSRDLHPNIDIVWNGNQFSTNEFGMRDRSYQKEKLVGTYRIVLLGPSHVMGNGVSDGETFENLVEERLNRDLDLEGYSQIEILNFGVDGFALPQQYALMMDRVFDFSPDMVIVTQYHQGSTMTETYLGKILSGNAVIEDDSMRAVLATVGLDDMERGSIPVPYESGRRLAKRLGLSPRMPHAEMAGRIHWITEEINEWAIKGIAQQAAVHGAVPVLLALDEVIDIVPEGIPNHGMIQDVNMPVIDLFDIYSQEDRNALRVAPWDDHPNAKGHRLIADHVYAHLLPLLGQYVKVQ